MKIKDFVASLESEEDVVDVVENTETEETVETPVEEQPVDFVEASEVETELLSVNEEAEEVTEMAEEAEEAEEVVEALESLIASLESIVENGGMDENAARMYRIAQESIYGRLNITIPQSAKTSLESFGDISSRHTASVISLEEEKGRFAKIVEGVWKFIQETVAKFVNWIKGFFNAVDATEKRAKAMLEAVKKHDKFEGQLTDKQKESFGKKLNIEGKNLSLVDASEELASFATKVKDFKYPSKVKAVSSAIYNVSEKIFKASPEDRKNVDASEFDKANADLVSGLEDQGDGVYVSERTLGNHYVLGIYKKDKSGYVSFAKTPDQDKPFAGNLAESKAEAETIIKNVIKAMESVRVLNKETNEAFSDVDKQMKSLRSKVKEDAPTEMARFNAMKKSVTGLIKLCTNFGTHTVNCSKVVLDGVSVSMKEVKEEAPEKEAATA